jgi:hypothetical protein
MANRIAQQRFVYSYGSFIGRCDVDVGVTARLRRRR